MSLCKVFSSEIKGINRELHLCSSFVKFVKIQCSCSNVYIYIDYSDTTIHFLACIFLTFVLCAFAEILEGGVQIIQNKFLSYGLKIKWLDIVKDSGAEVIIEDNGPESEWSIPFLLWYK